MLRETKEELLCQLLEHVANHWRALERDHDEAPHEDVPSLCKRIGHRGGIDSETMYPTQLWVSEILRLPHVLLHREESKHSAEFYALLVKELLEKAHATHELEQFFRAFLRRHPL